MNLYIDSRERSDAYRVCLRGLLIISPFLILTLIELFVLPIDYFTFRIWEAALSGDYRYPAMYYPNLHIKKEKEYGDAYRSGIVQTKSVEWFTDSYGWRNRPEVEKRERYDAVVIGDSNIVGSFLDQKNTLAEVLSERAHKTVYTYASESTALSLFFSDPRPVLMTPSMIFVESKAGNWFANDGYLAAFREMPDGSLDVIDRTREFSANYYSKTRIHALEKIMAQVGKHSMLRALKADYLIDFAFPVKKSNDVFVGQKASAEESEHDVWKISNWVVEPGLSHISSDDGKTINIRKKGSNAFLKTEKFIASNPDGKIIIKFQAKNSILMSKYRVWVTENGLDRTIGEFVAEKNWETFEIPVTTKPGSVLSLHLEQLNNWQWLSIKDFKVLNARHVSEELARRISKSFKKSSPFMTTIAHEVQTSFPRPANLTPLDGSGHVLTMEESRYYFYQAVKALHRRVNARNAELIFFLMPDSLSHHLLPAVSQLRKEGIKVIAYVPQGDSDSGVVHKWYWNKADSHWTEAAVRLTADEILRLWTTKEVANRPFSKKIMAEYSGGFSKDPPHRVS